MLLLLLHMLQLLVVLHLLLPFYVLRQVLQHHVQLQRHCFSVTAALLFAAAGHTSMS
jgi:hypothetical protein